MEDFIEKSENPVEEPQVSVEIEENTSTEILNQEPAIVDEAEEEPTPEVVDLGTVPEVVFEPVTPKRKRKYYPKKKPTN